ncbi:hypothetical protein SAMN05421690_101219 [Nitrosomonas sp. Nm51]|uniref:hypothetical protein n=1 Tax=Nitrosomonas sp. Nm51 TaxID=133720 RepID=UPI0008CF2E64|nr:hypothetical protein [Nitrosomonas sp. Nm51]SER19791.1 hypothetical protein SAMN05421690_101219 [Nitrosomonas sp. Nm51]
MKTGILQNINIAIVAAVVFFALPVNAIAAGQDIKTNHVDHDALVHYYEAQANEMLAKIDEQIDALKHKSRSSYFGKHGQDIKKHVKYKIHEYEKAAVENMEKAAYHKKMAEKQGDKPVFADSGNTKS